MMKQIPLILGTLFLTSCMTNYQLTTFYVKNTAEKTINFKASVVKYSSMGAYEMTLPLAVPPNDSIIARQVKMKKGLQPNLWFTQFNIFPTDGIAYNDPNNPANWVKTTDAKGKPVYTFTLNK